jgi:hypothetical protein
LGYFNDPAANQLRGTVLRRSGEPWSQTMVLVRREPSEFAVGAITDERGQFSIEGLLPGRYRLLAAGNEREIDLPPKAPPLIVEIRAR